MRRVVLIGMAGGGKSTLARRISSALDLPLHQMDKICFRPGWQWVPNDEIERQIADISATERWIIEGWGTRRSLDLRCDIADTLILIDLPTWRHYLWAYKRNLKLIFSKNSNIPAGCSKWRLWRIKDVIYEQRRGELVWLRRLLTDRPEKRQFVLRSPREIRDFCSKYLDGVLPAANPAELKQITSSLS